MARIYGQNYSITRSFLTGNSRCHHCLLYIQHTKLKQIFSCQTLYYPTSKVVVVLLPIKSNNNTVTSHKCEVFPLNQLQWILSTFCNSNGMHDLTPNISSSSTTTTTTRLLVLLTHKFHNPSLSSSFIASYLIFLLLLSSSFTYFPSQLLNFYQIQ